MIRICIASVNSGRAGAIAHATLLAFLLQSSASAWGDEQQARVAEMLTHEHRSAQMLVRFKPNTPDSERQALWAARGAVERRRFRIVDNLYSVDIPSGDIEGALLAALRNPHVLYAEPNYIGHGMAVPDDPGYISQWGMKNIHAEAAWDRTIGDADFLIAVIDSGIDLTHPDLLANLWTSEKEFPGDANGDGCPGECGVDDDGDGLVDECPDEPR